MSNLPAEPTHSLEALRKLVRRWNSRYIGERLAAERELKEWGAEAAELLLILLQQEGSKRRKKRFAFWAALYGGLALGAGLLVFLLIIGKPELLGLLGMLGGLGGLSALLVPTQDYIAALQIIAQIEDTRFTGYLAEALHLQTDPRARIAFSQALLRLLPRLTQEDISRFTKPEREAFYRILKIGERNLETELILATLEGLERLEDTGALPAVAGLSRLEPKTENERQLQERAQKTQVALTDALERERTEQTLLRASMPSVSGAELLRPAQATQPEEETLLLRASEGDSSNENVSNSKNESF
jgi:hypothetical protein